MRGKGNEIVTYIVANRITPAYAGKRTSKINKQLPTQDHPRLCGEKLLILQQAVVLQGSPPPMRGKARDYMTIYTVIRITPAYAGKSTVTKS